MRIGQATAAAAAVVADTAADITGFVPLRGRAVGGGAFRRERQRQRQDVAATAVLVVAEVVGGGGGVLFRAPPPLRSGQRRAEREQLDGRRRAVARTVLTAIRVRRQAGVLVSQVLSGLPSAPVPHVRVRTCHQTHTLLRYR